MKYNVQIDGLDCADCALHLEQDIQSLPGIERVKIHLINKKLRFEINDGQSNFQDVRKIVEKSGYSVVQPEHVQETAFIITGMDCADESRPIEKELMRLQGIQDISFNLIANKLTVRHTIPENKIISALKRIGFDARSENKSQILTRFSLWRKYKLLILTILSGVFAISGMILNLTNFQNTVILPFFLVAVISGGIYIFPKGLVEARNLRLGMNFLMSLAVIGALFIGEWSEAAMVVFLFTLAQLLESYSVQRARRSIESLMELAPNTAWVKSGDASVELPVQEVKIGDTLVIKPGDRIPMDGIVTTGTSYVNQSSITGESDLIKKASDSEVFAGTINQKGTLEIRVTREYSDSTIAKIIHLVEEAQAKKAPTQSFVEKFAYYYTPAVVSLALLMAIVPALFLGGIFREWLYRSLVLLVISCPCALVISTPVTIVSALTNAARNGILVKGGAYLENFSTLKALAFDKTGTLTLGKPAVQQLIPVNYTSEEKLIQISASLENYSEHPIADAIVEFAKNQDVALLSVDNFEAMPGQGIRGEIGGEKFYVGNHRFFDENNWCQDDVHDLLVELEQQQLTTVIVGNSKSLLGIITLADAVRANAKQAIKNLHRSGIKKILMLTGDNEKTAEAIASAIEIDEFRAGLLPGDKAAVIMELRDKYGHIAMVGDGINDAPALATATIGISMGYSGTDTALETADIALMKDDLSRLPLLKRLSSRTAAIIKQNIFIALFLKAIFVALAIPGLATLWMAVFADMGASLIVVTNGLRALKSTE